MATANTPEKARISYAQNAEDILLDRLFGDQVGAFLDVGANHPIIGNNTYFFYERGWRGVNIEPIPDLHRLCVQRRADDLNLAVAVSNVDGELPFYVVPQDTALSTLSAEVAAKHRASGREVIEQCIPVRTLRRLIDEYQLAPPDFVTIDVENGERQVLEGLPLATWRPKVLVVESTLPASTVPSHESWEPLLTTQGYLFAAFNGINRFYLREDLASKLDRLRVPVNVQDYYQPVLTAMLQRRVVALERQIQELEALHQAERAELEQFRAGAARQGGA
jgi:FkbM family methyltransferase